MVGECCIPKLLAIAALGGLCWLAGAARALGQEFAAGLLDVSQGDAGDWQAVSFAGGYEFQRPVLITGPLSYNNGALASVRVRDGDALLDAYEARAGTPAGRAARAPYEPKPKTGLTVFSPQPRPFDPAS